ncbi:metal-sensitive transcriptional regulator [bacterium]|jgi:CsoR family transcriptional regulator, copper-sensing transcriptional repressor|nr:metal-sensitive transcriptional regulator [bacterium]MBT4250810.1 metal-sensitive transcriptional regulator [bacterium]MBT4597522.1 metal-sensitive transcriptional regulator [bacterium]MBT6753987.1 metal-sensitive transcriptional regulator [bacterium]MBT7037554.1 metal-sensitive transcriptional regulator [bacterium]
MTTEDKKIITALKKASTHSLKVVKMVEEGAYCIDIMQQNLAAIGLLRSANNQLMERHLHSCFANAMRGTNEKRKKEMIEELLKIEKLAQ